MQAKKRYLLLISCCAFLSIVYFGYHQWKTSWEDATYLIDLRNYLDYSDHFLDQDISYNPRAKNKLFSNDDVNSDSTFKKCRMETCFDFSLCDKDFKVYVYPLDNNVPPSDSYLKVLRSILGSKYYTSNPSEACVFVLSLDTLDRDNLSRAYVRNMQARVQRLTLWNNGQNHIIFNLYSGTWPDYIEDLGFDVGKAILAKASISVENFRPGFDISLPLFHKTHPEKGGDGGLLQTLKFPDNKKYLLAFKGKRYLYGIGSETRNSVHHLHNEGDVIMLTTCKHLENWKDHKDKRCDRDNELYDSYDYQELLVNSTFCLVPRGRRLGSFRFLEVLQAGCIPIILANGWELPFGEVLDWKKAAIWMDERLLLQVPDLVRSVSAEDILYLKQQTQNLWNQYFSSVEKIIYATLEIVYERTVSQRSRPSVVWNYSPGTLSTRFTFSDYLGDFPFYYDLMGSKPTNMYTAIIHVVYGWVGPLHTSPLYKLIKNITKSKYVQKIIILWGVQRLPAPTGNTLPGGTVPIVVRPANRSLHSKYQDIDSLLSTDALFSLDEDSVVNGEEMDFAFEVWKTFPERIVGYPARTHYWDVVKQSYVYSSKWTNSYSMVLTGAALYHRYYRYLYANYTTVSIASLDVAGPTPPSPLVSR